jgi:hypothetical protein
MLPNAARVANRLGTHRYRCDEQQSVIEDNYSVLRSGLVETIINTENLFDFKAKSRAIEN